jgi:biotin transport system substrate-specific component
MAKPATLVLSKVITLFLGRAGAIVISASLSGLCARVTLPLPFTPVPLTLQNFGVPLVG